MGWGGQVSLLGMEFNPVYLLVALLFGLAVYFFFGVIGHFFRVSMSRERDWKNFIGLKTKGEHPFLFLNFFNIHYFFFPMFCVMIYIEMR